LLLTNAQVFLLSVQGRREGLQFNLETMMLSPPFPLEFSKRDTTAGLTWCRNFHMLWGIRLISMVLYQV
jgi:hypothetical protein